MVEYEKGKKKLSMPKLDFKLIGKFVLGAVAIVAAIIGLYLLVTNLTLGGVTKDMRAVRALKEADVQYKGSWVTSNDKASEGYIPDAKETLELKETADRSAVYSATEEGETEVGYSIFYLPAESENSGIVYSVQEPSGLLEVVRNQLTEDAGLLTKGGNPSFGYDIEIVQLPNGMPAVKMSGSLEVTLRYQDAKKEKEPTEEQSSYDFCGYIFETGSRYACAWGLVMPGAWDYCNDMAGNVEQMACTVWSPKDTRVEPVEPTKPAGVNENLKDVITTEGLPVQPVEGTTPTDAEVAAPTVEGEADIAEHNHTHETAGVIDNQEGPSN